MGECLKKAPASTGEGNRGQSKRREPARLSGLAHTARIFQKYRGRRREAGATNPSANVVPRRGTEVFRFLIFTVRRTGRREARPLSRRRPLSSTGAGDFEVRSRYAPTALRLAPARLTQSSTSFRNRRLMRGARLLLLPALGFLSALFRCLRHLPSLLRHAALLAVSEWRCRPCPRGSRTLHWDYYSVIKKPVFLQHQARLSPRRHHRVRLEERAQTARHAAQHDRATPREKFFRTLKNPHNIWLSDAFDVCAIAESAASA